jgi:pimeloyl-ACP methyl ester carboxylesterase
MECTVGDVTFNYEDVGSGIPLLTLHGWPLDHRHMLSALEPAFTQRSGWRRLYPDLPGMGLTPAAASIETHDHMLELVLGLVDRLIPGERFAVAGTSYGGLLARGLVHERGAQIAGVMLCVPVIGDAARDQDLPEHRVRFEDGDFLEALQPGEEDSREMIVAQSVGVLEEWRRTIFPAGALADHAFLDRLGDDFAFSFDPDELAQPCEAPALILSGRFDDVCGYREAFGLLDLYPNATYAVLDWAGHSLPSERKVLHDALVSDWLERVEAFLNEPVAG